jgi:uncharacterized protein YecE (DUF72 family)
MQESHRPLLVIGTSGFSYRDWMTQFYPPGLKTGDQLPFYARKFRSLEVNVSFYQPVAADTLLRWRSLVPEDFQFTMKASRLITHFKKLRNTRNELKAMWQQFEPLKSQLSCVLFQLPPSLKPDYGLLASFLETARKTQEERAITCPLAVEFRNDLWYGSETFSALHQFQVAPVLHDMPARGGFVLQEERGRLLLKNRLTRMPLTEWMAKTQAAFGYLRFHGTVDGHPWQEYGEEGLRPWVRVANEFTRSGTRLFAYFNNDSRAAAARDAQRFTTLLAQTSSQERASIAL